jgi:hypothetical protein
VFVAHVDPLLAVGFGGATSGTIIDLALLWFLVVLFTGSISSEQSYRETWIAVFGTKIVGLVSSFTLPDGFRDLGFVAQSLALFYLVTWACGTDRRTTLKICGWYLVVSLVFQIGFHSINSLRST